jgi:tyrosyl-tRNA synthetase
MFGKIMSISDTLMARYYLLLLNEEVPAGHPMDAKKALGRRVVERYHGADAAAAALEDFNTRFSKKDLAHAELPVVDFAGALPDLVSLVATAYERGFQLQRSRGEARRLIEQGSVQLGEEKLTDPKSTPVLKPGVVIKLDKTRAVRIR